MGAQTVDDGVPFSLVLVEDIKVLRDGLTDLLGHCGFRIAAAVRTAGDALRAISRLTPDAVLVDAASVGAQGPELVQAILSAAPGMTVVAMDLLPRQRDVVAYIRAGVAGFVLRDAGIDQIAAALRSAVRGERVLPPALAGIVFAWIADRGARRVRASMAPGRLTGRERQVCDLVGEGLSNKEIASRLHIATHTVKSHVHNLLGKLALQSRVEIVAGVHDGAAYPRGGRNGAGEDLDLPAPIFD